MVIKTKELLNQIDKGEFTVEISAKFGMVEINSEDLRILSGEFDTNYCEFYDPKKSGAMEVHFDNDTSDLDCGLQGWAYFELEMNNHNAYIQIGINLNGEEFEDVFPPTVIEE